MTPEGKLLEHLGSLLIGTALSVIGWLMATFTKRHLESMDKLTERIGHMSTDVAVMRQDITAIKDAGDRLEKRVGVLEQHDRDR